MKPSGVDGAQAIERLRNGGQSDLAAKVELALSFAYAEGRKDEREGCSADHCEFEKDAERYRLIRSALLSGGPEWAKLAAMLNIAPDTAQGVDDAVDATFSMGGE